MHNYVISLKKELKRREHIKSEFSKQDIKFNFFDAVTPETAKIQAENLNLNVNPEYLTSGELACFMSHVALWQKAIDENIAYISIFEDDIFLGENASVFLNNLDWVNENLHVVKLEAFLPRVILGSKVNSHKSRKIFLLKGSNLGAAGYVLSLEGANALMSFICKQKAIVPIDHIIFELYRKESVKKVAQIVPALCIQELELNKITSNKNIHESSLIRERHERMKKYKVKGLSKLKRELYRIFPTILNFVFAKKVYFK